MDEPSKSFADWACDPKRSVEEKFGAELLIEGAIHVWRNKHKVPNTFNWEAIRLHRRERALNPAYQPVFTRDDAERIEEILPELESLSFGNSGDDRIVRDISALLFCPALKTLQVCNSETRDWTPLRALKRLANLYLNDNVARDLRPLDGLAELKELNMNLGAPWPDLSGVQQLGRLEKFQFNGNLMALRSIASLPSVREATIGQFSRFNVPLRCAGDLPDAPRLRRLFLGATDSLDGIEKFPLLLNLEVCGYFEDLAPLAALEQLTHATIGGGDYPSLAPLAALPRLRRLAVRHEEPPDFTPLADAPAMHEIFFTGSPVVPADLQSLNSMFNPWSEEFALPGPRPLKPVRLILMEKWDRVMENCGAVPRDWGDDTDMATSEAIWFEREVARRFPGIFKCRHHAPSWVSYPMPDNIFVTVSEPEDIDRLPQIVQGLRELLARARHPWNFMLVVNSMERFERGMDEIYAKEGEEFDAEREKADWEHQQQQQRERKEFLQRKYRYRLQQELGQQPKPADFSPAPPPEPELTVEDEKPEFDLGLELHLVTHLTQNAIYVPARDRGLAEMLFEMKGEFRPAEPEK